LKLCEYAKSDDDGDDVGGIVGNGHGGTKRFTQSMHHNSTHVLDYYYHPQ
jgi:hypothetical protein